MRNEAEKSLFANQLKEFAATLGDKITRDNEWTIRGFIDIFRNIHTISSDTKIVSKVLELHLFPHFLSFAESVGYNIELNLMFPMDTSRKDSQRRTLRKLLIRSAMFHS